MSVEEIKNEVRRLLATLPLDSQKLIAKVEVSRIDSEIADERKAKFENAPVGHRTRHGRSYYAAGNPLKATEPHAKRRRLEAENGSGAQADREDEMNEDTRGAANLDDKNGSDVQPDLDDEMDEETKQPMAHIDEQLLRGITIPAETPESKAKEGKDVIYREDEDCIYLELLDPEWTEESLDRLLAARLDANREMDVVSARCKYIEACYIKKHGREPSPEFWYGKEDEKPSDFLEVQSCQCSHLDSMEGTSGLN